MNTQAASPGCPDLETISAVFDGEFEPDEDFNARIAAFVRAGAAEPAPTFCLKFPVP